MSTQTEGGGGGSPFDDSGAAGLVGNKGVQAIQIRHGQYVDAISVEYAGSPSFGLTHGGNGGSSDTFRVVDGDYIIQINGRAGNLIDGLQFVTRRGVISSWYGGSGGSPFTWGPFVPAGGQPLRLRYFTGRSGEYLDALGADFN